VSGANIVWIERLFQCETASLSAALVQNKAFLSVFSLFNLFEIQDSDGKIRFFEAALYFADRLKILFAKCGLIPPPN
jgi:hypothetical protein